MLLYTEQVIHLVFILPLFTSPGSDVGKATTGGWDPGG